jgi:hypothetical protein
VFTRGIVACIPLVISRPNETQWIASCVSDHRQYSHPYPVHPEEKHTQLIMAFAVKERGLDDRLPLFETRITQDKLQEKAQLVFVHSLCLI